MPNARQTCEDHSGSGSSVLLLDGGLHLRVDQLADGVATGLRRRRAGPRQDVSCILLRLGSTATPDARGARRSQRERSAPLWRASAGPHPDRQPEGVRLSIRMPSENMTTRPPAARTWRAVSSATQRRIAVSSWPLMASVLAPDISR
jgi:hypothetical protein